MISRYVLLILFNIPFVTLSLLSIITQYKLKKIERPRFVLWLSIWLLTLAGLVFAGPIYRWLASHNLTASDSLSVFDVIQITAIIALFYLLVRLRIKAEQQERRLRDLHQELSIRLSTWK